MPTINWTPIRQEYIVSTISQRDLAKKFHVSESMVAKKSSDEDWPQLRGIFTAELEQTSKQLILYDKARYLVKRNLERSTIYNRAFNIAVIELNKLEELSKKGESVNVKQLAAIIKSMELAGRNERIEDGQPPTIEKLASEMPEINNYEPPQHYTLDELEEIGVKVLDNIRESKEKQRQLQLQNKEIIEV